MTKKSPLKKGQRYKVYVPVSKEKKVAVSRVATPTAPAE